MNEALIKLVNQKLTTSLYVQVQAVCMGAFCFFLLVPSHFRSHPLSHSFSFGIGSCLEEFVFIGAEVVERGALDSTCLKLL